ncbi:MULTISPECIES: class A beta-lactamase [unclassified Curtobacterium]|uniref:class A beta-lactamase n=1 Tax=unclassified Curtobacterium TaxID=257496 RepID=UPI000AF35C19|nr:MULTISPECIES: class A beta-lactamase [unclassified Curtobacterium]WIA96077.1 class A beta-lactamase [Curtobacterium sp. MCBA15_004]WIA99380.1 class A beta-lactamase [Curtobacterium sp. MCBA15_012]
MSAVAGLLALAGCSPGGPTAAPRSSVAPSASTTGAPSSTPAPVPTADAATRQAFAALEARSGARVGVVALDTGDGHAIGYHADERFAFASTNKVFIAAAVLDAATGSDLDEVVHYDRGDLLSYAPVTRPAVDTGLTVRQLVDAAVRSSDNTAANLLVERLGGVEAVSRWLRSTGDDVTDVSRTEPDLNTAVPGDRRDTTTPAQSATDLRAVLLGDVLDADDRALLLGSMRGTTTGDGTIRAGVDPAWTVADKTGTASYGVRNDVAVVTPPGRDPIVLVVMTSHPAPDAEPSDALVAEATRTAVERLGATTGG